MSQGVHEGCTDQPLYIDTSRPQADNTQLATFVELSSTSSAKSLLPPGVMAFRCSGNLCDDRAHQGRLELTVAAQLIRSNSISPLLLSKMIVPATILHGQLFTLTRRLEMLPSFRVPWHFLKARRNLEHGRRSFTDLQFVCQEVENLRPCVSKTPSPPTTPVSTPHHYARKFQRTPRDQTRRFGQSRISD